MAKNIFLMYNTGRSGGTWFTNACNLHPEVQVWGEIKASLPGFCRETRLEESVLLDKYIRDQFESNPNTTIGIIKCFYKQQREFCKEKSGRVVQSLRNPINIVVGKMGDKTKDCAAKAATVQEVFEKHIQFYASHFRKYIVRSGEWPIIKLEEMNESLRNKTPLFKKTFEYFTQVGWTQDIIDEVPNMYRKCHICKGSGMRARRLPCLRCQGVRVVDTVKGLSVCPECEGYGHRKAGISNCPACGGKNLDSQVTTKEMWGLWNYWQQEIFMKYFAGIMDTLGYTYG